ncbi:MAG: hypothetical protein ACKVW3_06285 [Phycisphaerales bacterium]
MSRKRVIVELTPVRLRVAIAWGGAISDRREQPINEPNDSDAWPAVLDRLQGSLCEMVGDLDASGALSIVVYAAPSSVVGVFACAAKAGPGAADDAARLALAEAAGFSLDQNPWSLRRLAVDVGTSPSPQRHVLGVAEQEQVASALHTWATRAGLTVEGLVPIAASAVVLAAEEALSRAEAGACVVMRVGEHGSVIVAAANGALRLTRQLPIGVDSLVGAIAREIHAEPPVTLSRDEATRVIASVGVPRPDQEIPGTSLRGAALLPLLQPVLQRCVVEVRQSVRFGFEEKDRARAVLACSGAGGVVPRLGSVFAEQCGLAEARIEHIEDSLASIADMADPPFVLPGAARRMTQGRRVRQAMAAGFIAAGTLVAADGVMTHAALSGVEREIERLRSRHTQLTPTLNARDAAMTIGRGLASARQQIASTIGDAAAWDAVLAMLAQSTPETIRLASVTLSVEGQRLICRLDGHASGGADPGNALTAYLDGLSASPLVEACRLGATQRTEQPGGATLSFQMSLTVLALPTHAEAKP